MKNLILFLALLLITPQASRAAIFDAADYLQPDHHAAGVFGEALLSDPSSQGLEGRYRMGILENLNAAGILGFGSQNRGFRLGGEAVYNFIPDLDNQPGVSGIGTVQYLRRQNYGSLQFRVAPMISKNFVVANSYPANVYISLPLYLEIHQSQITTSTQFVGGAIWDLAPKHDWYMVTEGGIKLAKSESYILLGFGLHFETTSKSRDSSSSAKEADKEYRSEDFKK